MSDKNELGIKGETLAQKYLQQNGFNILHINWRYGHKEIDIVAKKSNTLHIVEVKTRTSTMWEEPKAAVVRRKQKNLLAAAEAYIQQYNINVETQFDVISVIIRVGEEPQIEYISCAFLPSEI